MHKLYIVVFQDQRTGDVKTDSFFSPDERGANNDFHVRYKNKNYKILATVEIPPIENLEEEELIPTIDEELDNCIKKLRNAYYGYEIRTFITEYEELMLKKSDLVVREYLKREK